MFYFLYERLFDVFSVLRLFKYITVRSGGAAVTAFFMSVILGPYLIRWLYRLKIGQEIRKDECPPLHLIPKHKQRPPTMGGILIITSVAISTLLWAMLTNYYVWVALCVFIALGAIGFVDDYLKVKHKQSLGLRARSKIFLQIVVALCAAFVLLNYENSLPLYVPFYKYPIVQNMGYFFLAFAVIVLVGSSNAVNLTDGLDGLAIGSVIICVFSYTIFAYVAGHAKLADYLNIFHTAQMAELSVFCSAIVGAGLGFLWYNANPAMVFMGDTGSLALGGAIGITALLVRKEIILLVVGGIFVLEAFSVILQVGSFKLYNGKRLFKMAPIHHHFEMKGWPETRVTVRLWIVALICAMVGVIITLKLQ